MILIISGRCEMSSWGRSRKSEITTTLTYILFCHELCFIYIKPIFVHKIIVHSHFLSTSVSRQRCCLIFFSKYGEKNCKPACRQHDHTHAQSRRDAHNSLKHTCVQALLFMKFMRHTLVHGYTCYWVIEYFFLFWLFVHVYFGYWVQGLAPLREQLSKLVPRSNRINI